MFKTYANPYGLYIVSIFFNGSERNIIIDDRILCNAITK